MKYLDQKKIELNWLKSFCPELDIPNYIDPVDTKFLLMKELKARTILSLKNSVTLIWPLKSKYNGMEISYRYQRQDFSIKSQSPLEIFYPGLESSLEVTGHFTRSGQSATFGLFLALRGEDEQFSVGFLNPTTYFETLKVIDWLKVSRNKESDTQFLDSSMLEFGPLQYLSKTSFKRLIVDTTNWRLNAPEIQQILDWTKKNKIELFLIRSHLKLDSLGAEYGLLGSIVRVSNKPNEEWEKYISEVLSFSGLLALHEQIYPFLWDETFLKLTQERTERIKKNTHFLTHELEPFLNGLEHPLRLRLYNHGLFFGVYFSGQVDPRPETFLKLSLLHQVPAKYCDSFGFDFLSLTNVVSFYEKSQESLLRFCPGDNNENIADALKLIKDYLISFDQRT